MAISFEDYLAVIKQAEANTGITNHPIAPENTVVNNSAAPTTADEDVRRAQIKITKSAAPTTKLAQQLSDLHRLMQKKAVTNMLNNSSKALSKGLKMPSPGSNMGVKNLNQGASVGLTGSNKTPALNPKPVTANVGMNLNVGKGTTLKPGVGNPVGTNAPATQAKPTTGSTGTKFAEAGDA